MDVLEKIVTRCFLPLLTITEQQLIETVNSIV